MSPVLRFEWLPSLLVWLALPLLLAIAAMPAIRGRLISREGVFPRRCGVLVRVGCLPHRSALLLSLLPAITAIALLLAIEAQRASQLRMRTSACSIQTMTGLRTFNPKVVGSSPTGGTTPASAPVWAETFFMAGRHSAGAHSPPLQIGAKSSTLRQNSAVMMESSSAVQLT